MRLRQITKNDGWRLSNGATTNYSKLYESQLFPHAGRLGAIVVRETQNSEWVESWGSAKPKRKLNCRIKANNWKTSVLACLIGQMPNFVCIQSLSWGETMRAVITLLISVWIESWAAKLCLYCDTCSTIARCKWSIQKVSSDAISTPQIDVGDDNRSIVKWNMSRESNLDAQADLWHAIHIHKNCKAVCAMVWSMIMVRPVMDFN